jgi:hypothetical protein
MNLTHSSKGVAIAVLLAITVVMAGTAAAISVSGEMPEPAEEGTEVSMEVTIDSPMTDQPSEWNLVGQTELENATWFVEVKDSAGETISEQQSVEASEFTQALSSEAPVPSEITVRVSGQIPELGTEDLNYEKMAAENYTVMTLTQDGERTLKGGEFRSHRYVADSKHKQAREAIDDASAVVEDADSTGAEDLDRAIAFYKNGDFDRAIELAEDAEQSADDGLPVVLIGGAVVVVLLIVAGGVYYWRSQQTSGYKLQ